jgi:O-antigen/teichoic acid export membrane protein
LKQSIASDAVKLTTSKFITLLISLVTAMLLSRFRTLEEYGTYSQIMLVISLTTTIFMLGLPNSINYFLARTEDPIERNRFLSVYYTFSTILSFIAGLVLVISAPLIVRYFDNALIKNFIYVLAIYPWARIIQSSIDNVLIVYKKTNHLMAFRIINSIFLLLIIIIVESFNWGFAMYMALFIVVEAVFAVIVYILVKNIAGNIKIYFDKTLIRTIMNFSLPIGLASVVGTLKTELDKLVIAGFYDTESLAIYTNAAREMPVNIIASSITAVLMPQMVKMLKRNEKVEAVNLWGNATLFSYVIICFFATGLFVYAPEVMSLLYSDKYISGAPVFRVYALVLLFRSTYFGMVLNSIGKTKIILNCSVIALVLNFVLNFIFYYMFGFIGPAIATLVATLGSAMYLLWSTSKTIKIPFVRIFPWKTILYITMINILFGFAFAVIKQVIPLEVKYGEVLESVSLGLIWGVLYLLVTYKFLKNKWDVLNE